MNKLVTEWDFNAFYKSDSEFLNALEKAKIQIKNFNSNITNMRVEAQLKEYYSLDLEFEKLVTYSKLKSDLDISNELYINFYNRVCIEKRNLDSIKNHINEEIRKINIPLNEYMKNNKEASHFYMHFYDILRLKKYDTNSNVVINENMLIQRINDMYNTIIHDEMKIKRIKIAGKNISVNLTIFNNLISNKEKQIREKVFRTYMDSIKSVNKSISNLFKIRYQMCFDIAKEKGYNSIIEQVIKEEDLDIKIINNLISSVNKNLPLLKRYLNLKKKKLGLKSIHYYDLKVFDDIETKYSYNKAIDIIHKALDGFGKEYHQKLNKVLADGTIDLYPNNHKFIGEYHFRNYIKPMILMNYQESFGDVSDLAHEIGHAVNSLFIKDNQSFQDFHYSSFLSEIPSTVSEDRIKEYLYKNANKKKKIFYLEQILDKAITAIFHLTMFLEFQIDLCNKIEEGQDFDSNTINSTFLDLFKKYYQDMYIDEELKYLWETRVHFFFMSYKYYNFQYSIGKIASIIINKNIDDGKIDNYLEFLKIGGSKPPLEALNVVGLDFIKKETFTNAFKYIEKLLNDYETLLKTHETN